MMILMTIRLRLVYELTLLEISGDLSSSKHFSGQSWHDLYWMKMMLEQGTFDVD
jgi:hypothetical protein